MTSPRIKIHVKKRLNSIAAEHLDNVDNIDVKELLNVCRNNEIIVRGSPRNMSNVLKKKLYRSRYCKDPNNIMARAFIRYVFWKLGKCSLIKTSNNVDDFYTSKPINEIPECFVFCTQTDDSTHCYDIRSLSAYREIGSIDFRNPYTDKPFSTNDIIRMNKKIMWLERFGHTVKFVQKKRTRKITEQDINQYIINVFTHIMEHQYVDYMWFSNLDFDLLIRLYHELHEIWNYRLPMQESYKKNMVKEQVFSNWANVRQYQPSMINKLRIELIKNIEKLVTEGATIDHRKAGCYIFMLGLVLVSEDAATSHPALYQAAYYDE